MTHGPYMDKLCHFVKKKYKKRWKAKKITQNIGNKLINITILIKSANHNPEKEINHIQKQEKKHFFLFWIVKYLISIGHYVMRIIHLFYEKKLK